MNVLVLNVFFPPLSFWKIKVEIEKKYNTKYKAEFVNARMKHIDNYRQKIKSIEFNFLK